MQKRLNDINQFLIITTTEGNKDNNQKLSVFVNLEIKSKKLIELEIEIIIKSTSIISRNKYLILPRILPRKFKIIPRKFLSLVMKFL